MVRVFLIVVVFMYVVVSMAYGVVFVVTNMDSGWSLNVMIERTLLWPVQFLRDLL